MSASRGYLRLKVAGLRPAGDVSVAFPRHQPGFSALVGFFDLDGRSLVLKVAKTDEVRRWAHRVHAMREPRSVSLLRRASARWNSLAPGPSAWRTLEELNARCHSWLASVQRATAEEALRGTPGATANSAAQLVVELFAGREELCFAPRQSDTLRVSFAGRGPVELLAVVQENVGSSDEPAMMFSRPIRPRERTAAERARDLEFLTLVAYARLLATQHGLGLDLGPRVGIQGILMPNVLVRRATGALVFSDYLGVAQRDGNAVEARAFGVLYGRCGLASQLASWVLRDLTRGSRPPSALSAPGSRCDSR